MNSPLIISILAMGGLGAFFAVFLVIASKKLHVVEDPLVEKVLEALPQTNCGACSYPGCHALAVKIAKGEAPVNACPAGGQEVADILADIMGIDGVETTRVLAVVLCRGGTAEAERTAEYRGDMTCTAADLTNGEKTCTFSCLGYGDCVKACNFESMEMNSNGLPVIFYDKCVGCGACAKVCPRDIIEMHQEDHKLFVYCRNKDKGAVARKICTAACVSCTLCVKDCEDEGGIAMKDNLAVIDYDVCTQNDAPTKRCPTKCIAYGQEEEMTSVSFYSSAYNKASGQS